jgi:hypothetical protein
MHLADYAQVFILLTGLVTWGFPTGGETFENEQATRSVVESQQVKIYGISRAASIFLVYIPREESVLMMSLENIVTEVGQI